MSEQNIDDVKIELHHEDSEPPQYHSLENSSLLASYLAGNSQESPYFAERKDWKWNGDFDQFSYSSINTVIKQEPLDFSMPSNIYQTPNDDYQSITDFTLDNRPKTIQTMEPLGIHEAEDSTSKEDSYSNEEMLPLLNQIKQEPDIAIPDMSPQPKKRGRKKKAEYTEGNEFLQTPDGIKKIKQEKITDTFKPRKKIDRFDGMAEEEVMKRTLPDHLIPGLDIIIIGINPGLTAAFKGHHYAGPGNHFWKCLFLAGLIPEPMTALDDYKLLNYGIGFTNIVSRTTKGSADLSRKEIKEGAEILIEKLKKYQPKIAVFNGKMIYEVFSGKKTFDFGRQPEQVAGTDTTIFVMPSSSARCAQLPRATDKVPFYVALKKLRDHLCGLLPHLDFTEVSFPDIKLKVEVKEELQEYATDSTLLPKNDQNNFNLEQPVFQTSNKRGRKKKGSDDASGTGPGRKTKQRKVKAETFQNESWNDSASSEFSDWQKWQSRSKDSLLSAEESDLTESQNFNCSSFGNFSDNCQNLTSGYFSPDNKTYCPQNYSTEHNNEDYKDRVKTEPYDPEYGDY